jgi:hypothetical protein
VKKKIFCRFQGDFSQIDKIEHLLDRQSTKIGPFSFLSLLFFHREKKNFRRFQVNLSRINKIEHLVDEQKLDLFSLSLLFLHRVKKISVVFNSIFLELIRFNILLIDKNSIFLFSH